MNEEALLCLTCWSEDRKLIALKDTSILNIEQNFKHTLLQKSVHVCWECHSLLSRFTKFGNQIKYAQAYLEDICKAGQEPVKLRSLSKLTSNIKTFYDAIIIYNERVQHLSNDTKEPNQVDDTCGFDEAERNFDLVTNHILKNDTDNEKGNETIKELIKVEDTSDSDEDEANCNLSTSLFVDVASGNESVSNRIKEPIKVEDTICFDKAETNFNLPTSMFLDVATNNENVIEPSIKIDTGFDEEISKGYKKSQLITDSKVDYIKSNINKIDKKQRTLVKGSIKNNQTSKLNKLLLNEKIVNIKVLHKSGYKLVLDAIDKEIIDERNQSNNDMKGTSNEIQKEVAEKDLEKINNDKFEKIILTEEQILKTREVKRNEPNYMRIPYKCETCVLGFLAKDKYKAHLTKKHDKNIGNYTCTVCEIRFKSQNSIVTHMARHYTRYKCKMCNYETVQIQAINGHIKLKHEIDKSDMIHCKECDYICKNPDELTEHVTKDHIISCQQCGSKFKGKNTLGSHMRLIHNSDRSYSCEICKLTFKTASRFESHLASHTEHQYYCIKCKVQYKNIYVYRNHLKNSKQHVVDVIPCSMCDKKFASKDYLKRHRDFFHLKKSKFQCAHCDKMFMSRFKLKIHNQTHHSLTRTRNYECDICSSKFFSAANLKGHMVVHSKERKLMCSECGDTFKHPPSLYTHVKFVHGGRRRTSVSRK